MIKPFKLGYVNFFTNKLSEMKNYYSNIMGLSVVETGEDNVVYLSTGLDHHNIILTKVDEPITKKNNIKAIGYQIDKESSLDQIGYLLKEKGIKSQIKSDPQPGVSKLISFKDPSGNLIELFQEMEITSPGYNEIGIAPNKLGHIALGSKSPEETIDFYKDLLNFTYTDTIGDRATFLTCNNDHHVLNISNVGVSYMHHIAFELRDASHQYASSDLLAKHNIPIVWGPTRHTAGHNIATYHHDPDNNLVELFIDMDILIPELGYFDPRPWHEDLPQKPKVWDDNAVWKTRYETSILDASMKGFYC